jgi:hypothetical protein
MYETGSLTHRSACSLCTLIAAGVDIYSSSALLTGHVFFYAVRRYAAQHDFYWNQLTIAQSCVH